MLLKEKPSAAELRHIYGDLRKKELHEFKISTRAISSFGAPGFVYEERMNLPEEFSTLSVGAIIWDVACGTGEGTCELQEGYPDFRFLAINPHVLPRPWNTPMTVPFITGYMERLDNEVMETARDKRLYPPQAVIISNGLQYSARIQTLDWSFRALDKILPVGGKVLIYEDAKWLYRLYPEKIQELSLPFQAEELRGIGESRTYLRLCKQ